MLPLPDWDLDIDLGGEVLYRGRDLDAGQSRGLLHDLQHIALVTRRGLADLLGPSSAVTSIILTHSGAQPHQWPEQPDLVIEKPNELLELLLQ